MTTEQQTMDDLGPRLGNLIYQVFKEHRETQRSSRQGFVDSTYNFAAGNAAQVFETMKAYGLADAPELQQAALMWRLFMGELAMMVADIERHVQDAGAMALAKSEVIVGLYKCYLAVWEDLEPALNRAMAGDELARAHVLGRA